MLAMSYYMPVKFKTKLVLEEKEIVGGAGEFLT